MKSVLGKYWQQEYINESFVSDIAKQLSISDFLAKLIAQRVKSLEEARDFINPKIKNLLPDPFHLLDMDKAVKRVTKSIKNNEKICLFADYDVDGATAASLLKNIFNQIRVEADIYIPDRITEGYGPSIGSMEKIRKNGTSLVITLDCGSVAFEALEYASKVGLEVIVIDHHLSLDNLPQAIAIINPNRLDETSKYKNLAAVGVAFLFSVALCSHLKKEGFFEQNNLLPPNLINILDLVALGTVCDVMSLTGLNRALVAQGLKITKSRNNIGYRTLCDIAGIEEEINSYHLGFILGPRINAGGRVGKSLLGAKLLSTTSTSEALIIAEELEHYNNERKVIEFSILEQADTLAQDQKNNSLIFIAYENWHSGVIGIVASRLKEKYNKPVAVIALNGSEGRASCRSIRGIDFGAKIMQAKINGILISGGGHPMAAGFTVKKERIKYLHEFLEAQISKDMLTLQEHLFENYSTELTTKAATIGLTEEVERLEPFGNGNPHPIFKFCNLYVLKADIINLKHIKIIFAPTRETYISSPLYAIAFNAVGTKLENIIMSSRPLKLSVFGVLKINKWKTRETVQLYLKDIILE